MYKICPECKTKNLDSAKYCFNCEYSFTKKVIKMTNKKIKESASMLESEPEDILEHVELTDAAASQLQNIFRVESEEVRGGIRFEDAIGTMKGGREHSPRRTNKDRRSGKMIMKQEGGNSARLRERNKLSE